MTAQVPPPVDFGDINDLLRQANGESTETFVWKSKRQQLDRKQDSTEQEKLDNTLKEVKEEPRGKKKGAVSKADGQARHAGKAKESPTNVQSTKDNSASPSSSLAISGQHLSQKTNEEKKCVSRSHVDTDHDEILKALNAFGKLKETAHRHMIFMPDKLYHDLVAGYGQRNLSAILCTLARLHVEKYKKAMRQMIASRTDFFE